ncbi:hypothetical protein MKK63_29175 [Methylobacterium sp. J-088]|uniref:hypothetical protein n=1 Tax=Methylobacterium sp. J-088 TaxID=2836664 RepID=UPI001FBBEB92|nr:hypothetical protein [Methylobacterium sp. J-088]MCJ2066734.1 hypothetical protein [Methylobacterium sp. J-088]
MSDITTHAQTSDASDNTVKADFGNKARTGAFRGGASGFLYGLGDDGVPTQALINGAHITNASQKAPYGTQHPSGDVLEVETSFFAGYGKDMCIYIQDYYPDWAYNGGVRPGDTRTYNLKDGTFTETANGVWDYLEVIEFVTEAVATQSAHPERYVFVPFNEPDGGNWYANWSKIKQQFLDDWKAAYDKIQAVWARHGLGHARIGGPAHTQWRKDQSTDLLTFARDNKCLPDVFIWHELGVDNLRTYPIHYQEYRAVEISLGISPIAINITEYGMLLDMSVPGQLIQWMSLFEQTKIDAQAAYWNYAGNLSDNTARPAGANGGWWMFKWYGDLDGSETVQMTTPSTKTADRLRAIGAIDTDNRRATILWGGRDGDVALAVTGLDTALFGTSVDIEVRQVVHCGTEGLSETPRVIQAARKIDIASGGFNLTVPGCDLYSGYQILITPAQLRDVIQSFASQTWLISAEAENLQISNAKVFTHSPTASNVWQFLASGGRDVGQFNDPGSRLDWKVTVPKDGSYRLQVIGSTPGAPGRHALFVDGKDQGIIQYAADLALTSTDRWNYRGSAERSVTLTSGEHTLSIRASSDGVSKLPGSDITLDKLFLKYVGDGEITEYQSTTFRLRGGSKLDWGTDDTGYAVLVDQGAAHFYVTAIERGYYDVGLAWSSSGPAAIMLSLNGRDLPIPSVDKAGRWQSGLTVHLAEGINEIVLTLSTEVRVQTLTTKRNSGADANAYRVSAGTAQVMGSAKFAAIDPSAGSNVSGSGYVTGLGGGSANALQISRPASIGSGDYDVTIVYANAQVAGKHEYNPQVVDLKVSISEAGDLVGSTRLRYTYSWISFWQKTLPVTLKTNDMPVTIFSSGDVGPYIDAVIFAPVQPTRSFTSPIV